MPMPRREQPSRRLSVQLDPAVYQRLEALAEGKPIATVAGRLLAEAVETPDSHDARSTIEQLEHELFDARQQLDQLERSRTGIRPRWEQSPDALLSDREWWDAWLPSLHQLLGRRLQTHAGGHVQPVEDERGYADLMGLLFPPLIDDHGREVTWRDLSYPHWARLAHEADEHRPDVVARRERDHDGPSRPVRAEAWEPVLRHVAKALALLEAQSLPGSDPYLRMRADDEIRNGWVATLGALIEDYEDHQGSKHNRLQEERRLPQRPLR